MGEIFNAFVDNALTASLRLLELPLFALLAIAAGTVLAVRLVLGRLTRIPRGTGPAWIALALALGAMLILDAKLAGIVAEVRAVRTELREASLRARDAGAILPVARPPILDLEVVCAGLEDVLDEVTLDRHPEAEPIDYVWIRARRAGVRGRAEAQAHVAIIDLTHPGVSIRIPRVFGDKRLTSEFAREHDCVVAINGEAGRSPRLESGLGPWRGNWISDGEPVLLEDGPDRPFLSFDRASRARYFPAALVDREPGPEKHDTLFGRWDLLREGQVVAREDLPSIQPGPAPRCAMAIDASGTRLYLMVVDGRRPGHSHGLDLRETGEVLAAFGATDGMLCDQGGSACMFLRSHGGIVSTPSDDGPRRQGERPTYSHFGVAVRSGQPE